jgi:hypothetical protein
MEMNFLSVLIILIIIGCVIEYKYKILEGEYFGGCWLLSIVLVYILFIALLNNITNYDYIKSNKNIEILKIMQNIEGKYLVITKEYEKIESLNITLVDEESKLEKQIISQTKFDGFRWDKTEYKLYLNLSDVERGW